MSENYSALLDRMGELLKEVEAFKKDVVLHDQRVKKDMLENTNLLSSQKEVLGNMKKDIDQSNMSYRMNLEEVAKYMQSTLLSNIDNHINKKIEEINRMMKPLVNRVVRFQDSVNDFEETIKDSLKRLQNVIDESDKLHENHSKELEKFTEELSDKKNIDNFIITDEETLEDLVRRILDEKLYPIIERIG